MSNLNVIVAGLAVAGLSAAVLTPVVSSVQLARQKEAEVRTLELLQGALPHLRVALSRGASGEALLDESFLPSVKDAWGRQVHVCFSAEQAAVALVSKGADEQLTLPACTDYAAFARATPTQDTGDDVFLAYTMEKLEQGVKQNPAVLSDTTSSSSTRPQTFQMAPGTLRFGPNQTTNGSSHETVPTFVDSTGRVRSISRKAWADAQMENPDRCTADGWTAVSTRRLPSGKLVRGFCVARTLLTMTQSGPSTPTAIQLGDWQWAHQVCASKGARLITSDEFLSMAHDIAEQSDNWVAEGADARKLSLVRGYYTTTAPGTGYTTRLTGVANGKEVNGRYFFTSRSAASPVNGIMDAAGIPQWVADRFPVADIPASESGVVRVVPLPRRNEVNSVPGLSLDHAPQLAQGELWNEAGKAGQVVFSKDTYTCTNRIPDNCGTPKAPIRSLVGVRGANMAADGTLPSPDQAGGLFSLTVFQAPSATLPLAAARCVAPLD